MEQLKTATITTNKGETLRKLKGYLAVIILLIGVTASFPHRLSPSKNPKILELNNYRDSLKREYSKKEITLDSLLEFGCISTKNYLKNKSKNKNDRAKDMAFVQKRRKFLAHDFSFNGRSSLNFWGWVFGILITLLICSCFLAIKDARLKRAGLLKWYEPHSAVAFIVVSLFWLYHTIFRYSRQFELSTYLFVLILIIIPLSYFIYHFLRRNASVNEKLLENIRLLVKHALDNTKDEKEEEKWKVLKRVAKNGK